VKVPGLLLPLLFCAGVVVPRVGHAQVDPEKRQLFQLGYNQSLQGIGPLAAYAYYYLNVPDWPREGQTLRLAVAPVYVDGELAFREALGPQTHLAIGAAGGGFADSHLEVRGGRFIKEQSFNGHGGELSAGVYHLFNPGARIPLNGVARAVWHHTEFERGNRTGPGFALPPDTGSLRPRVGLRWGGREPLLTPRVAMELSAWYEGAFRFNSGSFGLAGDRQLESRSHLLWARALLAYTLPEREDYFSVNLTTGTGFGADRFSGYQLGAALPLAAEFPLSLPGYYFQEITARQFALVGGLYTLPLDARKRWNVTGFAATAVVDYVTGMAQPGDWHTGVGGGVGYASADRVWEITLGYAYGVDAMRSGGRGAHQVGLVAQYNLEAHRTRPATPVPEVGPEKSRGLQRLFRGVFGN
jgi:hypothetical protein